MKEALKVIEEDFKLLERLNKRQAVTIAHLLKFRDEVSALTSEAAKGTVLEGIKRKSLILNRKLEKINQG